MFKIIKNALIAIKLGPLLRRTLYLLKLLLALVAVPISRGGAILQLRPGMNSLLMENFITRMLTKLVCLVLIRKKKPCVTWMT